MRLYKIFILLLLISSAVVYGQKQEAGIGQWRDHTSYGKGLKVVDAGTYIYYSTDRFLARYDKEYGEIKRINTITGLSDVEISTIAYNPTCKTLIVGYSNANIDLIIGDKVINIPDIKRKEIQGRKKINHIYIKDNLAYLSCGFGVVVLNVKKQEIKEVYYLGEYSGVMDVYSLSENDTSFIAFTENGIYYADKNEPLLNNSDNWKVFSEIERKDLLFFTVFNNEFFYVKRFDKDSAHAQNDKDSLFRYTDTTSVFVDVFVRVGNLEATDKYLFVSIFPDLIVFDKNLNKKEFLKWKVPYSACVDLKNDNVIWIASEYLGLAWQNVKTNESGSAKPQGPYTSDVFNIFTWEGVAYVAPGSRGIQGQNLFRRGNVYKFSNEKWETASEKIKIDTITDIVNIIVDPNNPKTLYASSWMHGLVELNEDFTYFKLYDDKNSTLQRVLLDDTIPYTIRIPGAASDSKGNLWVANSMVSKPLSVKRKNGIWESYDLENLDGKDDLYQILVDYEDNIWIIGRNNKLIVTKPPYVAKINMNKSLENEHQTGAVNCIIEDFNGELWIGTDKGIKVIYTKDGLFNVDQSKESPVVPQSIIYSEDGHNQYLLQTEVVTCIAIDGANRKWIGTAQNGVFLLSADGLTQILHFTKDNSPLISNQIFTIQADQRSGEVFIGTDMGIISYKGTAIYGYEENDKDRIYAYPNPVRPDYNGPVAIKGLVWDAHVKITDAAGHIVYTGFAHGGQAVWNGLQNNGDRVMPGVYFVFITNEDGKETFATKLLVVR